MMSPPSARTSGISYALRADMDALRELVNLYERHLNENTATVNSLPVEILHYIFHLVAEEDIPCPPIDQRARTEFLRDWQVTRMVQESYEPQSLWDRGGNIGWIRLGHVCAHWYHALATASSLWAGALGSLPLALDAMMELAGPVTPLTLSVYRSTYRLHSLEVFMRLFSGQSGDALAQRVRHIDLFDMMGDTMELMDLYIDSHAFPLLESATIRINTHLSTFPLATRPSFDAPHHRSLNLFGVYHTWMSETLTCLAIGANGMNPLSLEDEHFDLILDQSASKLRELHLFHCFGEASLGSFIAIRTNEKGTISSRASRSIYMPHLELLSFGARIQEGTEVHEVDTSLYQALCFLRTIVVPHNARLSFSVDISAPMMGPANSIVESLWRSCLKATPHHTYTGVCLEKEHLNNPDHFAQLTLKLHSGASSTLPSTGSSEAQIRPLARSRSPLSITFHSLPGPNGYHSPTPDPEYLAPLVSVLDPMHITTFEHRGEGVYPDPRGMRQEAEGGIATDMYRNLLYAWPNVRSFILHDPHRQSEGGMMAPVMSLLCSNIFPVLNTVVLYGDVDLVCLARQLSLRKQAFDTMNQPYMRLRQLSIRSQTRDQMSARDNQALEKLGELADVDLR
ncbi:unnamed protein product [Peniophora sp. CBMAI 1063]|nr:unnamed protein product [Peniophora sp. CBMAI 1063]